MVVTEIALSDAQASRIRTRAAALGCTEAELIQRAVETFLDDAPEGDWRSALQPLKGIWEHSPDSVAATADTREAINRQLNGEFNNAADR